MLGCIGELANLGISVKVKVPKEIRTAAKEMPEFSQTASRLTSVLDASNITAQSAVAMLVMGGLVALVAWKSWK